MLRLLWPILVQQASYLNKLFLWKIGNLLYGVIGGTQALNI